MLRNHNSPTPKSPAKSQEINHRPFHSYIMQTHTQGQTRCILPSNSTWARDLVAYIRITTWACGQIEIFRPYVFSDYMPDTVVKSSLLGTQLFANTADICNSYFRIKVWFWPLAVVQGRAASLSLQTDPGSKITEVKAHRSHFISSVTAKINSAVTVTVNSCLYSVSSIGATSGSFDCCFKSFFHDFSEKQNPQGLKWVCKNFKPTKKQWSSFYSPLTLS